MNLAGSRGDAPYTETELCTTSFRKVSAFWQAASNCIVPMTLISFIEERPPALPGVATIAMCTTVSTPRVAITLAITGLRMSARTKSSLAQVVPGRGDVDPDDLDVLLGGERAGESGTEVARDPGDEDDPVRGHQGALARRLLAGATALDACALEQLAVLLLRHPLAALLDDRTHDVTSRSRDVTVVPDVITCRRVSPDNSRMLPAIPSGRDSEVIMCPELVEGQSSLRSKRRPELVAGLEPAERHDETHHKTGLVTSYLDDFSPWERPAVIRPRAWLPTDAPTPQPERGVEIPLVSGSSRPGRCRRRSGFRR